MANNPYGIPGAVPNHIRPQYRAGASFGLPWLGVDNTPDELRALANMPGVVGLIDPGTLKTIQGVGQIMRCRVSGAIYTSATAALSLVTKGKGRVAAFAGTTGFKPSVATGIVLPQERWTAMFVIAPDVAANGLGYLFSKVVVDANEGRPDPSIGMNNLHICEFDHSPGVASQIISAYTWAANNDYKVVAISQSPERGMTISINGVVNQTAPARTEGLSSVREERQFQIGDYGAATSLGYKGNLGLSLFCYGDYHDPRYAEPLARAVAAMSAFYQL